MEDAEILAVESRVERPWPFGIDIDGRLVFDIDKDHTLANFDLHIPKKRWVRDLREVRHTVAPAGDLGFDLTTLKRKSFSMDLRVRTDPAERRVRIEIGDEQPDHAVALSEYCTALLHGDQLVGFDIDNLE